jgi:rhodanese-related sulfurtransferase
MVAVSLVLLLLTGCTPSQSTTTPQGNTIIVTSPTDSVLQTTQNTTQPTTEKLSTVQPTTTPSVIDVPTISTLDAYNLIQNNKDNPSFIIIDVRTVDEFNSGHIANAINMDYYAADFKSIIGKLDINKQYLVYCRTGIRGTGATQIMVDLDFKDVHNLLGGIVQWINDRYLTVN